MNEELIPDLFTLCNEYAAKALVALNLKDAEFLIENALIYAKNLPNDPTQRFKAVVDEEFRSRTMSNHTATHLLHQASFAF